MNKSILALDRLFSDKNDGIDRGLIYWLYVRLKAKVYLFIRSCESVLKL